jgi:putative DNA primase/helicase
MKLPTRPGGAPTRPGSRETSGAHSAATTSSRGEQAEGASGVRYSDAFSACIVNGKAVAPRTGAVMNRTLARTPRWVAVELVSLDNGKTGKVPYCAFNRTRHASSTDPSTWTTFDAVQAAITREPALVFGFMLGDGWAGVDLDKVHDPLTGVVEPWALDVVALLDSYTESSVSRTGIHVLCHGHLPPGRRAQNMPNGQKIEMYDRARLFACTGQPYGPERDIEDRTDRLKTLHEAVFGPAAAAVDANDRRGKEGLDESMLLSSLSDDDLLLKAASASNADKFLSLWRGELDAYGGDHSVADLALISILLYWSRGDREQADRLFRQSDLMRPKWERRSDYRERTFAKAGAL